MMGTRVMMVMIGMMGDYGDDGDEMMKLYVDCSSGWLELGSGFC